MQIEQDVIYQERGARALHLDLYHPAAVASPTKTAIVLVHGGGWAGGNKQQMKPLASALAARGFLVAPVEYRLLGEAPWPVQQDDVVAALRWVVENAARLRIAPDRVIAAGASAGGHLAMLATAALVDEIPIAAVLALFPVSAVSVGATPDKGVFDATHLLGADATEEQVRSASPLLRINERFPPVFLLHGGADWLIDSIASLRVYERLVALSVPVEFHVVVRANHEFVGEPRMVAPIASELATFLDRVIVDPEAWDEDARAHNIFARGPEAFAAMRAERAAAQQETLAQ